MTEVERIGKTGRARSVNRGVIFAAMKIQKWEAMKIFISGESLKKEGEG